MDGTQKPAAFLRFRLPGPLARSSSRHLPLLALFLIVVGARFWLIQRDALAMPFWDQWDGIGALLLKPWLEGALDWRVLFNPHNEHRIVLTRLLSLGLVAVNGQWDNLLEAAVNALFCGFSAVCLAAGVGSVFGGEFRRTILLAVAVYFALPFGWENTLCGFQSQNYFLILFSLAAIWGLGLHPAGSGKWSLGFVGAILACGSMASGFLAAAAVLALLTLRWAKARHPPSGGEGITAALCLGIIAFGWLTRTVVAAHAVLQAESPAAFVVAFFRFMARPFCQYPVVGLLALLPLGWLALVYFRRPIAAQPQQRARLELLLGVGGWVLLQTAALAYGRGGQNAQPASRYLDLLALLPLVNFLAWLALFAETPPDRRRRRRVVAVAAAFWTLLLGYGLTVETIADFRVALPDHLAELRRGEQNTRGYVLTQDFARYLADKPQEDLPYPDPKKLAGFVDTPALRAVLPADLRPPPAPRTAPWMGFCSRWASFALRCGGFIFAVGAALFLLAALRRTA